LAQVSLEEVQIHLLGLLELAGVIHLLPEPIHHTEQLLLLVVEVAQGIYLVEARHGVTQPNLADQAAVVRLRLSQGLQAIHPLHPHPQILTLHKEDQVVLAQAHLPQITAVVAEVAQMPLLVQDQMERDQRVVMAEPVRL